MEIDKEGARKKLEERFPGLSSSFVAAILTIYEEVSLYRERYVRLPLFQFFAVRRDIELARKCLVHLLARDFVSGKAIFLVRSVELPLGGGSGWIIISYVDRNLRKLGGNKDG
ncbi:MAG: hypothetical protein ACOZAG_02340 [Patescibacteria group bacterium]